MVVLNELTAVFNRCIEIEDMSRTWKIKDYRIDARYNIPLYDELIFFQKSLITAV